MASAPVLTFLTVFAIGVSASCVDYRALGWYSPSPSTFHPGLPPDNRRSYIAIPPTLTICELQDLQQHCVDRINMYRNGTLKFSDSSSDPGVPKPALGHYTSNDRCAGAMAFGDLYLNNGSGGCAAVHSNAFSCSAVSATGQNSCCVEQGATFAQIAATLDACLQSFWDEGMGYPDDAPFTEANANWWTMRSAANAFASCGFAYDTAGDLWMNQDFFSAANSAACDCTLKNPGDADGCGGICVGIGPSCLVPYSQTGYDTTCVAGLPSGLTCTAACAAGYAASPSVGGSVTCEAGSYAGGFTGCAACQAPCAPITLSAGSNCTALINLCGSSSPRQSYLVITGKSTTPLTSTTALALGSHSVVPSGPTANCTFVVTVIDTIAPVLTCPPALVVPTGSSCSGHATYATAATDNCNGALAPTFSLSPTKTVFPYGSTPVTATARDAAGNQASCTFNVTVSRTDPCLAASGCAANTYCPPGSTTCPPATLATFQPAGALCRRSTGPCDPQEVCTGTSATCPADVKAACLAAAFFEPTVTCAQYAAKKPPAPIANGSYACSGGQATSITPSSLVWYGEFLLPASTAPLSIVLTADVSTPVSTPIFGPVSTPLSTPTSSAPMSAPSVFTAGCATVAGVGWDSVDTLTIPGGSTTQKVVVAVPIVPCCAPCPPSLFDLTLQAIGPDGEYTIAAIGYE